MGEEVSLSLTQNLWESGILIQRIETQKLYTNVYKYAQEIKANNFMFY